MATLDYIRERDVLGNVRAMGARFVEQLRALQGLYSFIGDVRGRGLMLGVEIVDPETGETMGSVARELQAACFAGGLMVELGGRNGAVMRLLPPLTITAAEVDAVCAVIGRACETVRRERAGRNG